MAPIDLTADVKAEKTEILRNRKILIVDDDFFFRTTLEKSLLNLCIHAICAESAKHAQQLICLQKFDLVLSDIQMPGMSGFELITWIQSKYEIPIVLMSGFTDLLEKIGSMSLDVTGFLEKPFSLESLVNIMECCFQRSPKCHSGENLDSSFGRIAIQDFISGSQSRFDIFVRISSFKYLKITNRGEVLPPEFIQRLIAKGTNYLYLKNIDLKNYMCINASLSNVVARSFNIVNAKKVNFIRHTSEILLQRFDNELMDKEDFKQGLTILENATRFLVNFESAFNILTSLNEHCEAVYIHSVGVSFYSTLIGKGLGWNSPLVAIRLALGGLLHDIGKKQVPAEVLERQPQDWTPKELEIYESHCRWGVEILSHMEFIPMDVIQIVSEHHENCAGTGFPLRLRKNKIHPLAKVVGLADNFCKLVLKNPHSKCFTPHEALERMMILYKNLYEDPTLDVLVKMCKFPGAGRTHRK